MELTIQLEGDISRDSAIHLKQFIEDAAIDGIDDIQVERKITGTNEMGIGDLLSSIKALIQSSTEPLVQLIKCLERYVNNYRTTITIPTKNGQAIKLEHGRSMKPEELKELVVSIQQNLS